MQVGRFGMLLFSVGFLVSISPGVLGEGYPTKPIRLLTADVGGNQDLLARLVAQGIAIPLGKPVVVENRPAAIYGEIAAKASPDGYSMVLGGTDLMFAHLTRSTTWDPVRDFAPVSSIDRKLYVLVVDPSLPVQSVKQLIDLAKTKPGYLNYASGPTGGGTQIAAELFKSMAGINIEGVSYKGGGPALNAVAGGEVQLTFTSADPKPFMKSGKLRVLAVTSAEPSILYPGIPTVAATGLPGYELTAIDAVWMPAGTPGAIISRINHEIVRVLNSADMQARFLASGAEAAPSSPSELAIRVKEDIAKVGKLIREAGIKMQ